MTPAIARRFGGRHPAFFLLVIASCAVIGFPFYWMFVSSVQSGEVVFAFPPSLLPRQLTAVNYETVLRETQLGLWLWNSFIVASVSTLLSLAVGTCGAFALSRFRYRGKQAFIFTILSTQMIPPLVLVIPLFKIFVGLDLDDTIRGLVLANFTFSLPIVVWMMKAMFDTVPVEIEEAARVDGASWWQVLTKITGPLVLPGLLATGIFTFLEAWDEFMLARTIVTSTEKWVATIGLASFVGNYTTPFNEMMAAAVLFTLPPVFLFLFVQKYFIAGLSAGAVKG